MMHKDLFIGIILISCCCSFIGCDNQKPSISFPGKTWDTADSGQLKSWSTKKLVAMKEFASTIGTESYILIENGRIIDQYGDTRKKIIVQSIRKSFLNALYGIQVQKNKIDINETLTEINIDDRIKLTAEEKTATIEDLMKSRSGIYLPAASSPEYMQEHLPQRGSHPPGTYWYYNNWDFNALGTIYQKLTGDSIFQSFKTLVADPIRMENFSVKDCYYQTDSASYHAAYHFSMSANDMARFGLLFLNKGYWKDQQIITPQWIQKSTTAYSGNKYEGYGLMWWADPASGDFSARGGSGQLIWISPDNNFVFVHTVDRHNKKAPQWPEVYKFIQMIKDAKK